MCRSGPGSPKVSRLRWSRRSRWTAGRLRHPPQERLRRGWSTPPPDRRCRGGQQGSGVTSAREHHVGRVESSREYPGGLAAFRMEERRGRTSVTEVTPPRCSGCSTVAVEGFWTPPLLSLFRVTGRYRCLERLFCGCRWGTGSPWRYVVRAYGTRPGVPPTGESPVFGYCRFPQTPTDHSRTDQVRLDVGEKRASHEG